MWRDCSVTVRHLEERKPGHLNQFKLGSVESNREPLERTVQCLMDGFLASLADTFPRIGTLPVYEVPSLLPDHSVERCRSEFPNNCPVVGDRFPAQFHTIRKNATLAQKNGMNNHACALLDTFGTSAGFKPGSIGVEGVLSPVDVGCSGDSWTACPTSESVCLDSSPDEPVASDWMAGWRRCIPGWR